MKHVPVLLNEVIGILDPKPGKFFIDGTVNGGGYAEAIIELLIPNGRFLGLDWDRRMAKYATERFSKYEHCGVVSIFLNENFTDLREIIDREKLGKADGLVLDLGFSSEQLAMSSRGFSFEKDEPLIMTYSDDPEPVRDLLKKMSEMELAKIIRDFSQERYARRIARAIKEQERLKPIETTGELVKAIKAAVPKNYERGRLHPATRTFLALRIYANRELENLEAVLKDVPKIIKSGGRIAVVSFQSLEDGLVKKYFRHYAEDGILSVLTKKPLRPGEEEILINPRSRSARLRAAEIKNDHY